jgi:hypothetical protein
MTVSNRSNDLIWGTYGANMVHFNLLLTYVAAAVGVPKGYYHQVSSNTHLYMDFPITQRFIEKDEAGGPKSLSAEYARHPFLVRPHTIPLADKTEEHHYKNLFRDHDYEVWEQEFLLLNFCFDLFIDFAQNEKGRAIDAFDELEFNISNLKTSTARNLMKFMLGYAEYKSGNRESALHQLVSLYNDDPNPFFYAGVEWMKRRKAAVPASKGGEA